MIGTLATVL